MNLKQAIQEIRKYRDNLEIQRLNSYERGNIAAYDKVLSVLNEVEIPDCESCPNVIKTRNAEGEE